jgi:hypothetical protein
MRALLLTILFLTGCASIHKGKYAQEVGQDGKIKTGKSTKSGIIVSGSEVKTMASKHFTQLDFTFENTTNSWIKVDKIKISYVNKKLDKLVKVPLGAKLHIWSQAATQNKAISDHNFSVAMAGIAAGAAAAGGLSSRSSTRGAAGGLLGASVGAMAYQDITNKVSSLELSKVVPQNHLLHSPLFIPPGLHAKKWITLYLKNPYKSPYLDKVKVSYRVNGKKSETVLLTLRGKNTSSDFQDRYHAHHKKISEDEKRSAGSYTPY